jgi:glycosyltransferase involved in cell wall biosynthesis
MKRQVAVFAPVGTLDHQTGIMNAIRGFARAGWRVEVFAVRNRAYPEPRFSEPDIRVHFMPFAFNSEREHRTLATLLFTLWMLMRPGPRHRVIFAGGIRGLVAADVYSRFVRTRFINYQTELYVGAKLDARAARVAKAIERAAARRAFLTVEHDEGRKKILCEDLGVKPDQVVIVPNAPFGPARRIESTFLHARLGIASSVPVLLSPGTLTEAFEITKLVRAAQALPESWRCVIHSAQPRSDDDPYIAQLKQANRAGRVVFSLRPIPYERIDDLIGSACIGVALYSSDLGENTSTVGLASGKLSHFLKAGIPVIVSPLPGLADFVLQHGVGEVLEREDQLPVLVARIEADLQSYRERCLRCFDQYLSYERSFERVLRATDVVDT